MESVAAREPGLSPRIDSSQELKEQGGRILCGPAVPVSSTRWRKGREKDARSRGGAEARGTGGVHEMFFRARCAL